MTKTTTHTPFTPEQLKALRAAYANLDTVSPERLATFHQIFDGCADARLQQLAKAHIKFVSKLAINACTRRGFDYLSGDPLTGRVFNIGGMQIVEVR